MLSLYELLVVVLLCALATYRVSHMIVYENGFFHVFIRFRDWIMKRFGNGWVNEGVNCILCVSWWLSILPAIWIVFEYHYSFIWGLILWNAIAGISIILFRLEKYWTIE